MHRNGSRDIRDGSRTLNSKHCKTVKCKNECSDSDDSDSSSCSDEPKRCKPVKCKKECSDLDYSDSSSCSSESSDSDSSSSGVLISYSL